MLKRGGCILCTRFLGYFLIIESFSGKRKELHEGYEYLHARAQQSHDIRLKELELQERRLALDERQMAVNESRVALDEPRMSMEEKRLDLEVQIFHDDSFARSSGRERQLQQFSVQHTLQETLVLALKGIVKDIRKLENVAWAI